MRESDYPSLDSGEPSVPSAHLAAANGTSPDTEAKLAAAAPKLLRLSTDAVEPPHRLAYWIEAISGTLFSVSTSSPEKENFNCVLTAAPLDSLVIVHSAGSRQTSTRTRLTLANDSDYSFHLIGDFRKPWVLNWRGTDVALEPGDLILTDTRYAHGGAFPDDCSVVNVKMAPTWVSAWLRNPDRIIGKRICRQQGWGAALSGFMAQLSPELAIASPLPPKLLAENLGAMLSLIESDLNGQPPLHRNAERQTLDSVQDAIRQRAAEHGLTATEVAVGLRISERTLHRSLAVTGKTFAMLLQQERIELAKRMLNSEHFNRLTTAEIGSRAGFADPSYFVRALTRHVGLTPSRYRKVSQE